MKKIHYLIFTFFIVLATVSSANAHSGRTDSLGCHTCRTNCASWGLSTGEYHCHRAKSLAPQPIEPVTSHKVEGGVGYTEPAPEYKMPVNETINTNNIPLKSLTDESASKDEVDVLGTSTKAEKEQQQEPLKNNTIQQIQDNSTGESEDNFGDGFFWGIFIALLGVWGYKKIKGKE